MEPARKFIAFKADINRLQRLVGGYISTIDPDMDGDVVLPEGCDTETYFNNTKSVTLFHDADKPVGVCRNLDIQRGRGIYTKTFIARTALGDDVLTMIEDGVIRGLSIEWDPRTLVARRPTSKELAAWPGCKQIFDEWTLLAYSFTPRPCNPGCVVDSVKDDRNADMVPVWERMESLFTSGKIRRSSAVAAGFPDTAERKSWAVTNPAARKAVWNAGGVVVR